MYCIVVTLFYGVYMLLFDFDRYFLTQVDYLSRAKKEIYLYFIPNKHISTIVI